jgi:hypothetical protein
MRFEDNLKESEIRVVQQLMEEPMNPSPEEIRQQMQRLLNTTRRETRLLLSSLDPDRIIHTDERAWRVRDILGHLGVWNGEAVRSLTAYAQGGEYFCIPTEEEYYDYNGPAADERRAWTMDQIWAEYETAHDQLKQIVESLPDDKWDGEMVYPWNERGGVEHFIRVMMAHEKVDHCALVIKLTT